MSQKIKKPKKLSKLDARPKKHVETAEYTSLREMQAWSSLSLDLAGAEDLKSHLLSAESSQ